MNVVALGLPAYTGPYISDGKLQSSVLFGRTEPVDELDALSRLHDTAYAYYGDAKHREAADAIYYEGASKLNGTLPKVAAVLVKYGNYVERQFEKTAEAATGGVFGLAKLVVSNLLNTQSRLDGTYLKQERSDVLSLYSRDPVLNMGGSMLYSGIDQLPPTQLYTGEIKGTVSKVQDTKKETAPTAVNKGGRWRRRKRRGWWQ
jgi:hypothetical protein